MAKVWFLPRIVVIDVLLSKIDISVCMHFGAVLAVPINKGNNSLYRYVYHVCTVYKSTTIIGAANRKIF